MTISIAPANGCIAWIVFFPEVLSPDTKVSCAQSDKRRSGATHWATSDNECPGQVGGSSVSIGKEGQTGSADFSVFDSALFALDLFCAEIGPLKATNRTTNAHDTAVAPMERNFCLAVNRTRWAPIVDRFISN